MRSRRAQSLQLLLEERNAMQAAMGELESSRQHYADLFDLAPIGYLALDRLGCIREINLTGAAMLGRKRSYLLGSPMMPMFDQAGRKKFLHHVGQLRRGQPRAITELSLTPRNGPPLIVQLISMNRPRDMATVGEFPSVLFDLTARKRAEAALQQSEQRLRLALAAGRMGTWELDLDNGRMTIDETEARLLGLEFVPENFSEEKFFQLVHPDDRKSLQQKTRQLIRTGGDFQEEFRLAVRSEGAVRWIAAVAAVVRDGPNQPPRLHGVHFDITRRKVAADSLRQNEHRLRMILNTALDGIVTIDAKGAIADWNAEAQRIFGWTKAEALGKNFATTITTPRNSRELNRNFRQHARTGLSSMLNRRVEITALHRDGNEFPAELSITPSIVDEQVWFTAFLRDITERRRTEGDLRKAHEELERRVEERTSELIQTNTVLQAEIEARRMAELARARLAAIVESSSDAILSTTLDGVILSWNHGAERLFGYSSREVAGRSVSMLVPLDRVGEWEQVRHHVESGDAAESFETIRLRKDGSGIEVSMTLSPITDEAGRVAGYSAIMRDISERKRMAAEILRVSEREQRRVAEDLHDGVGQQLAGLSCLSDALKKDLAKHDSPETAAAARICVLQESLVTQVRGLARGLHPVALESEGLMSALNGLAARVTELFKTTCTFQCQLPVPIEDNSIAIHLYRIAQEAISNAIRHGRAQRIEIGLSATRHHVILSVRDDGLGIVDNEESRKGMGLRIMNYRAGMIGASIVVQRRAGRGTEMVCTVPRTVGGRKTE
jgi:PAS domain S-box-containing protein